MPVTVSYPVERDITDYADFTVGIVALDFVQVRAHVWGQGQESGLAAR
jgi:hypothetical protein